MLPPRVSIFHCLTDLQGSTGGSHLSRSEGGAEEKDGIAGKRGMKGSAKREGWKCRRRQGDGGEELGEERIGIYTIKNWCQGSETPEN